MTAIAGRWCYDERPDAGESCGRMLAAQRSSGPHASDIWDGGGVALGRSLYRLLPEDRFDEQPLIGGGGKFVLVADLRLDNREELSAVLGLSPERARESSDAAILLRAYERWREACFGRILGDYAVAIWEADARRLLLVRDPLGMRPLHYHRARTAVTFSSMPKGLHALPHIPRLPDEIGTAEFAAMLPEQGPRTCFKDVQRVEPGHLFIVTATGATSEPFWNPSPAIQEKLSFAESCEGMREHLRRAVRARLRSNGGNVGTHLSAGLDSSSVATAAAGALQPSGGRLTAFTGAPREGYRNISPGIIADESTAAALTVAAYPNIDHVVVRGKGTSMFDALDRYFHLFEQPIRNVCNAEWVDGINDAARARNISVMLMGIMGNLSMSYDGIQVLPDLLRAGRLPSWLQAARALTKSGHARWHSVLANSFGPFVSKSVWRALKMRFRDQSLDLTTLTGISRAAQEDFQLHARARERGFDDSLQPRKDSFSTRLWALRRVDMGNWNKGTLSGWGIDQRDPTADIRLIEFCLNIRPEYFMRGGITRAPARAAFAGLVPDHVLNEVRRGYQGADWHERLTAERTRLNEEIIRLENCAPAARLFDLDQLKALAADWPQSGWDRPAVRMSYRQALLRSICVSHFLRSASGSNQ